jgi:hypothetical protein
VILEIHDASGVLVRRLTSEPTTPPPAEAYFAKKWIRPPSPLPRDGGMHRVTWDLRFERPMAVSYDYSIGTVAGGPSPISPGGAFAPPGRYQVTLTVDGAHQSVPLDVRQDPRTSVADADFQASLALSREIAASLAIAWRGHAEQAAAHAQLATLTVPGAAALADKTAAPEDGSGFGRESGILAGVETDLESADLAPTQPQRDAVAASAARVDALWRAWTALRDGALASLDARLAAAGRKPVVIPPPDKLTIEPGAGGEDLP